MTIVVFVFPLVSPTVCVVRVNKQVEQSKTVTMLLALLSVVAMGLTLQQIVFFSSIG